MKRLLLIVMIAGIALRAAGQVSSPDPAHSFAADLLLGGSTIRGGGTWRSADLVITHTAPHTVGYLFLHHSTRPEGTGSYLGIAATHDWTSRFFTYAAVGGSPSHISFLPDSRFDVEADWKVTPTRLLLSVGGTAARYPERRRTDVLSAGLTYYAPVIVTYRYFLNRSQPGSVRSHAQLLQAAIEQRGKLSVYLRQSWGVEAYQLTNIVVPQNVHVSGRTTTALVRKWTTPRAGVGAEIERQAKGGDFRRLGVRLGAFYTF
ncbi:MAG TPA: YaiO family outer membrane beta-barrel protein [Thermoanaerobaculia bacterium]|jgi:YaiO family outer membrane protein